MTIVAIVTIVTIVQVEARGGPWKCITHVFNLQKYGGENVQALEWQRLQVMPPSPDPRRRG